MSRYTKSFKLKVVDHYLTDSKGYQSISKQFKIHPSQVERWVRLYKSQGEHGLSPKGTRAKYTLSFKQSVIAYRKAQGCSLSKAADLFDIASPSTIYVWEQRYNRTGLDSEYLLMTKPSKQSVLTNKSIERLTPSEMAKELHYLRVENAYLKKLEALIQQKKSQTKKK